MSDKERHDRFYAFVQRAAEAGVTVSPQRGARQFMIQFPEGNLFLAPEATAIGRLIDFASDPELCPCGDFLSVLLDLRTDLADLTGQGRVSWSDLFASSFTISLGDWLKQQGFTLTAEQERFRDMAQEIRTREQAALAAKRAEEAARAAMTEEQHAQEDRRRIEATPRDQQIAKGRQTLAEALFWSKYSAMNLRAQCKYADRAEADAAKAVGTVFSEEHFIRFYALYEAVLLREKRRIAAMSDDQKEAEFREHGSGGPPSEFTIAQEEALEEFQSDTEAMNRFEEAYNALWDDEPSED